MGFPEARNRASAARISSVVAAPAESLSGVMNTRAMSGSSAAFSKARSSSSREVEPLRDTPDRPTSTEEPPRSVTGFRKSSLRIRPLKPWAEAVSARMTASRESSVRFMRFRSPTETAYFVAIGRVTVMWPSFAVMLPVAAFEGVLKVTDTSVFSTSVKPEGTLKVTGWVVCSFIV